MLLHGAATTAAFGALTASPASRDVASSLPDAPDGWLGLAVGPYRLIGRVGQGGMGTK